MPIETGHAVNTLLNLKREIEELENISRDASAPVTLDQQSVGRLSRMDALQQQAMAKASEQKRAHALMRIQAALDRLEVGDYGYCVECGEEIPLKRLEIDPAASHCVNCARTAER